MAGAGRPRAFDREEALEAAMLVFWRKGFAAASIADLCEAMGIRSPSLYAAFGDKEALYREAVAHYLEVVSPPIWGGLGRGADARADVEAVLMAGTVSLPAAPGIPAGCMAMLGAVGDEWPASAAEVVRAVREKSFDLLHERLTAAVAAGELAPATDVDLWSRFYLAVFQGMAIQARDGASTEQLRGVVQGAMAAWPGR